MDDKDKLTTGTAVLDKPADPVAQPASSGSQMPPTLPTAVGADASGEKPMQPATDSMVKQEDIADTIPALPPTPPSKN